MIMTSLDWVEGCSDSRTPEEHSRPTPLKHLPITDLIASALDKTVTFRDLVRSRLAGQFLTGTPEQIADTLQEWFEAAVDGFNLVYSVTPGTFVDFIDGVIPVLQARGLVQREYTPGPLRQKIFGQARLPARHPAAAYRHG